MGCSVTLVAGNHVATLPAEAATPPADAEVATLPAELAPPAEMIAVVTVLTRPELIVPNSEKEGKISLSPTTQFYQDVCRYYF